MKKETLAIAVIISLLFAFFFLQLPILLFAAMFLGFLFFALSLLNFENVILMITFSRAALDCLRDVFRFGPVNITSFFSVFIIFFGISYFLMGMKKIKFLGLLVPLFMFLGICFISIFYSPSKGGSIEDFVRIASYFILALLISNVFDTKTKVIRFMKYFWGALIIPFGVGFYQFFAKTGYSYFGYNRLYATLQHPSSYVKFLNIFLIICTVFLILSDKSGKDRKRYLILLLLLIFQIVATFTRAGWIEAILGMCLVFWLTDRKALILVVLLGTVSLFSLPIIQERFSSEIKTFQSGTVELPAEAYLQGSAKGRFTFNEFLLNNMFLESPFFGKGIGSFFYYYSPKLLGYQAESHGDLSKLLGEVGFVGTAFFFFGFFRLAFYLFKKLQDVKDPYLYKILLSAVCFIILRIFVQNFDAEMRLVLVQWYYWSFYGIALACSAIVVPGDAEMPALKE